MKYKKIVKGTFLSRPNRFIAKVETGGVVHTVHVKNTGRCKELLIAGATVYLYESDNLQRKTKYDLIAVEKVRNGKAPLLINMDSQAPNEVVFEWLCSGAFGEKAKIKREYTFGESRMDFYVENEKEKILLEVKGVTLENNSVASFPDAPTLRGIKHINELIKAKKQGYRTVIVFVVQMKDVYEFVPNNITHKEFGEALKNAKNNGVEILAYDCIVTPDNIKIDLPVKVTID